MVDVFRKRKFEFLALIETKLKGYGEVSCCGVSGIIADVQEIERVKEGVAVLMNDGWHSALIDFGCVGSRILWVKFRFSRVKVCVVVAPLKRKLKKRRGSGKT